MYVERIQFNSRFPFGRQRTASNSIMAKAGRAQQEGNRTFRGNRSHWLSVTVKTLSPVGRTRHRRARTARRISWERAQPPSGRKRNSSNLCSPLNQASGTYNRFAHDEAPQQRPAPGMEVRRGGPCEVRQCVRLRVKLRNVKMRHASRW